jgi:hypothetical protein
VPPPVIDDSGVFLALSNNADLSSFPHLQGVVGAVQSQYTNYVAGNGNPWAITPLGTIDHLKPYLIKHYSKPPVLLSHIKVLRRTKSPDVCTMCGSLGSGTLDHVLPKNVYPEFAVFSNNLVPACICNNLRKETYIGTTTTQRVLHPYFDNVMNERLVRASFTHNPVAPQVALDVFYNGPYVDAVNFHINNVLLKTTILEWLESKWSVMIRSPYAMLMCLGRGVVTELDVRATIRTLIDSYDSQTGTPNNWFSIFYSGVLCSAGITAWLTNRINGINDGTIIPT